MVETTREKKEKVVKVKRKSAVEQEVAEVTRPGVEEKELAAETLQEEVAPEKSPFVKGTILTQCMTNPSFRTQVIHHLVKKLR